jgi:GT2 family glycosyltransferase
MADTVEAFLHSLPPAVSLIIVDSSTDETPHIIAACRPVNTRLLHHPGSVLEACQFGAESARTEWLLFSSAEVTFADDYFSHLPVTPAAHALYGCVLPASDDQPATESGWSLRNRLKPNLPSLSNLLIRREVLHAIGGLDITLINNGATELLDRVRRNGYQVRPMPRLVVYRQHADHPAEAAPDTRWGARLRAALVLSGFLPFARR